MRKAVLLGLLALAACSATSAPESRAPVAPTSEPAGPTQETRLERVAELEWARDSSVRSYLEDQDASVRAAAARALGRIAAPGDEIATAESATIAKILIVRLAYEKNEAVRRELIMALGQAGTPEAVKELVRSRDEVDPISGDGKRDPREESVLAARALRLAAREDDRRDLVRGLRSETSSIANESALALGVLERRLRAAGDATIDTDTRTALLDESLWYPRKLYGFVFALSAMSDARDDARAALEAVLTSASYTNGDDIRAEAARGLARSAKPDMPVPQALLADYPDARVATEVVHALAKHKNSKEARARLVEILAKHASFHARREAALALGEPGPEDDPAEIAALEKALEDPYMTVRANALLALAKRAPTKALGAADPFLLSRGAAARKAAAPALGQLVATFKKEATAALVVLASKDQDHLVRMSALEALGDKGDDATVLGLASDRVAQDDDPGIFETAVELLLKKGGPDTEAVLLSGYERTRDRHEFFEAREEIVTGLAERGDKLTDPGKKVLEHAATDPDASVVAAAAKATHGSAPKRERKKLAIAPRSFARNPVLHVTTSRGTFDVELFPELAPIHVANVVTLAEKMFYDGLTWHRVVSDFVIQGGCPRGDGSGDPGYTIPDELSLEPFTRGTLGMPKTATKDTGGCQLFFTHGRVPHLEGRYTVFGRITKGVETIDLIEEGDTIESIRVDLRPETK